MSSSEIAIKVSGVSKAFKLPHEKNTSVKSLFMGLFKGRRTYERQQVLTDVSFEVKKGEFFGIVGRNGSGKSTFLKAVAGIISLEEDLILDSNISIKKKSVAYHSLVNFAEVKPKFPDFLSGYVFQYSYFIITITDHWIGNVPLHVKLLSKKVKHQLLRECFTFLLYL